MGHSRKETLMPHVVRCERLHSIGRTWRERRRCSLLAVHTLTDTQPWPYRSPAHLHPQAQQADLGCSPDELLSRGIRRTCWA